MSTVNMENEIIKREEEIKFLAHEVTHFVFLQLNHHRLDHAKLRTFIEGEVKALLQRIANKQTWDEWPKHLMG